MDLWDEEKYRPKLETLLEVPHRNPRKLNNTVKSLVLLKRRMKSLMNTTALPGDGRGLASLLRVIGAPVTPKKSDSDNNAGQPLALAFPRFNNKAQQEEELAKAKMANYIVKQYVAAVGGREKALSSSDSLYAMGKVKITMSNGTRGSFKSINGRGDGHSVPGGFVLWQKRELWCLELMLPTGYKVSMGSDGKAPLPWHHSYAYQVPPLPLAHLLQGFNPWTTENLFSNSNWFDVPKRKNSNRFANKTINKEDCFILEAVVKPSTLSSSNVEIVQHTILGYFSQKTGLLLKLEDSRQLRLTALGKHSEWKSRMESDFQDYRAVDGVNIAHGVKTCVSLKGKNSEGHSMRRKVKLVWELEEVGLDIKGLSMECFLPPGDLEESEEESCGVMTPSSDAKSTSSKVQYSPSLRFLATKIIPIDEYDSDYDLEGSDISDPKDGFFSP